MQSFELGEGFIFKRKGPHKKYVQLKASLIENGTKVIVLFNDVTKIKEI